jgi:hypothetical protein
MAKATQRPGCAYSASQKKRLSVGVTTFPPGSLGCGALSNTQVVEVGREQENRDNEDEYIVCGEYESEEID